MLVGERANLGPIDQALLSTCPEGKRAFIGREHECLKMLSQQNVYHSLAFPDCNKESNCAISALFEQVRQVLLQSYHWKSLAEIERETELSGSMQMK